MPEQHTEAGESAGEPEGEPREVGRPGPLRSPDVLPHLVHARAVGYTIAAAAEQAGVSERTARRILSEPGRRAEVQAKREELAATTAGVLGAAVPTAVRRLLDHVNGPDARTSVIAARVILTEARSWLESAGVVSDLDELRAQVEALTAEDQSGGSSTGRFGGGWRR